MSDPRATAPNGAEQFISGSAQATAAYVGHIGYVNPTPTLANGIVGPTGMTLPAPADRAVNNANPRVNLDILVRRTLTVVSGRSATDLHLHAGPPPALGGLLSHERLTAGPFDGHAGNTANHHPLENVGAPENPFATSTSPTSATSNMASDGSTPVAGTATPSHRRAQSPASVMSFTTDDEPRSESIQEANLDQPMEAPMSEEESNADAGPAEAQTAVYHDRSGNPLSADTAQAVLPASACVFVANLLTTRTDEQLLDSVREVFAQYGRVYVKIRRDGRGMPFAFCQYETDEAAHRAILNGRRQTIDGRLCRTEPARVNRSVYMSRLTGGPIPEDEARRVLSRYGQIDSCWVSTDTEREMYQLPEGIWVKFLFFQDCRDAQLAYRHDNHYRLDQPPNAGDAQPRGLLPRGPAARTGLVARPRVMPVRPPAVGPQPAPRPADGSSIFIGNLPEGTTRDKVAQMCSEIGPITSTDVVTRPGTTRGTYTVFAFVNFVFERDATRAIQRLNQTILEGRVMRVEPRAPPGGGTNRGVTANQRTDRPDVPGPLQARRSQPTLRGAAAAATGTQVNGQTNGRTNGQVDGNGNGHATNGGYHPQLTQALQLALEHNERAATQTRPPSSEAHPVTTENANATGAVAMQTTDTMGQPMAAPVAPPTLQHESGPPAYHQHGYGPVNYYHPGQNHVPAVPGPAGPLTSAGMYPSYYTYAAPPQMAYQGYYPAPVSYYGYPVAYGPMPETSATPAETIPAHAYQQPTTQMHPQGPGNYPA